MPFSPNIVCKALPIFSGECCSLFTGDKGADVERREESKSDHEKIYASILLRAMCPHIYACKLSTYNPIISHTRQ